MNRRGILAKARIYRDTACRYTAAQRTAFWSVVGAAAFLALASVNVSAAADTRSEVVPVDSPAYEWLENAEKLTNAVESPVLPVNYSEIVPLDDPAYVRLQRLSSAGVDTWKQSWWSYPRVNLQIPMTRYEFAASIEQLFAEWGPQRLEARLQASHLENSHREFRENLQSLCNEFAPELERFHGKKLSLDIR